MKVLVVHGLRADSRQTTINHSLSFARHLLGQDVTYVNIFGNVKARELVDEFDLGIITYEVVALRNTPFWGPLLTRLIRLLGCCRTRVVMPQDDYSSCAILDDFVVKSGTNFVFTPIKRDLDRLYPRSLRRGIFFHEALTGYWESDSVVDYSQFVMPFDERPIDVGQRVRHLPPQLGVAAERKGQLAVSFADIASRNGWKCDVSTRDEDVLLGLEWWRFLGRTKFTIGRLGGASIGDPHGRLAIKVLKLRLRYPEISRDDLLARLRLEKYPSGDFTAISPRLFEASAMGVCQILVPDDYFEGFAPWEHYIPIEEDLSNVEKVMDVMGDRGFCEEVERNAREFLIESGLFTYRTFVRDLVKISTGFDLPDTGRVHFRDVDDETLFSDPNSRGISVPFDRNGSHRYLRMRRDAQSHWIKLLRSGSLMPESFLLPWTSAAAALRDS